MDGDDGAGRSAGGPSPIVPDRPLGDGLIARSTPGVLLIRLPVDGLGLSFSNDGPLVRIALQFGLGGARIDVSFQPGAVRHQVQQAARETGHDPNRWSIVVLKELRAWSGRLDWCALRPDMLNAALGALSHPLLREVYERGHAPLDEIPRWARPILEESDVTAASRILDPSASRRVTRALASSLVSREVPAAPTLEPLAFGVMATGLVTVDELASLIEAPPSPGDRALPTRQQLDEARSSLLLWPDERRGLLLRDAVRSSDITTFIDLLRRFWWIREQAPRPLPVRCPDLEQLCRRLVPVISPSPTNIATHRFDPGGSRAAVGAPEQPPAARPGRVPRVETPLGAPTLRGGRATDRPIRWPVPDELALVHGLQVGNVSLEVATRKDQLGEWGRILHNCLAEFHPSAASGRSWLIGIRRDRSLVGCVEVSPSSRSVRQILGDRNRPLPSWLSSAVLEALQAVAAVRV